MTYSYSISQNLNLTNATGLKYSYYWTAWVSATLTIYADASELESFDQGEAVTGEWTDRIIDVSSVSGNKTVKFELGETTGYIQITDVTLLPLGSADTYEITAPSTGWDSTGTTEDYSSYLKACNVYATTLGEPSYGTGNIVIDFATYLGNTTPATTWRIDRDIFRADLNEDTTRLATVVKSKGSGLCGATMFSYMADFATHLTIATMDSFLNCPAAAGVATLYVSGTTGFGTQWGYGSNKLVQVGVGADAESFQIDTMGAVATSPYIHIESAGTTSVAHAAYSPVVTLGSFLCTGATEDVDAFIIDVTSQSASYQTKSVLIGSEVVKLNDQAEYGTHSWYERIDDTTLRLYPDTDGRPAWDYGYSYPHTKDSIVYSNSWQLPARAPATTQFYNYSWLETHISDLGVVDNDTLDKLCWGVLENGTTNLNWGQFIIPAVSFPTSIDVGDWVSIEDRTGTGTTNYRIVGLEYNQRTEIITVSIGSTEDYFIDEVARTRSSFDLAYSK
jgi:hypothetical protein